MTDQPKAVMSRAEFEATPEFALCSDKARLWLQTLIDNGFDYTHATATAFNCKNLRQAQVFSYAVRKWPVVRAALAKYLGRSEQELFLEDLERTIRHAATGSVAQVRAQSLYARLKFGVSNPDTEEPAATPAKEPTQTFSAGDVVRQDGVLFTVTSVDAAGKILTAEEIESV